MDDSIIKNSQVNLFPPPHEIAFVFIKTLIHTHFENIIYVVLLCFYVNFMLMYFFLFSANPKNMVRGISLIFHFNGGSYCRYIYE